jgi:glucosamine--fructose-6-phosphate aminotransferase (isomerizing)
MDELLTVPDYIKNVFNRRREIKNCATVLSQYENAVVLASGMFYPLAKEGALKIKETSYINTSAYPTGEFLHGHIAILNKPCAVISFINNCNAQFTLEVLSRINNQYKANIMLVSSLEEGSTPLNNTISITTRSEIDFVFSALVVMQLIAFETAVLLGKNVDKPEGLSKIVK